jgi:hypothetical protein
LPLCLAVVVQDNRPASRAGFNPSDLVDIAPEMTPTAAPGEEP